jgi:hypothetical protein
MTDKLREEDKPRCFGLYNYPSCKEFYDPVITTRCDWSSRCKQSQEDS